MILGDAAHAMVPFYGQGMNCGFQDILVLDQILDKHHGVTRGALQEYSKTRNPDAEAICDLAVYNYEEMRSSVSSPLFRLRHDLEYLLGKVFPRQFAPLYTMVAFTEIPYSEVKRRWKSQERTLNIALAVAFGSLVVGFVGGVRAGSLGTDFNLPAVISSLSKRFF